MITNQNDNLAELMDAALEAIEDGIAVLDAESRVVAWNTAAKEISGYPIEALRGQTLPANFYQVESLPLIGHHSPNTPPRPSLANLHHREGHSLPVMLRSVPLRNALGRRFGTMLRFHPTDDLDALPHGEMDADEDRRSHVEESLAAMQDRLDEAWREWKVSAVPVGLTWITVDQAAALRKTHGSDACEAMLNIVERTLVHGLRPSEIVGRWGTNEFLVLSHERTAKLLEMHAQHLAELIRSSDFRWWGDRIALTASLGVSQAEDASSLRDLLSRAQQGMRASQGAGGNHVTCTGGQECFQS